LKQVDLEPRRHSSRYELKPMSRWWLLPSGLLSALSAYLNGLDNVATWGLLFFGALFMLTLLMVFPGYWLSRRG